MKTPTHKTLVAIIIAIVLVAVLSSSVVGKLKQVSQSNREMNDMISRICAPADQICINRMKSEYEPCWSTKLGELGKISCVDKITAADNVAQHPELITPNLTPEQVDNWAEAAAPDIMNFNYQNVEDHMTHVQPYFIPVGWRTFSQALQDSSLLPDVLAHKLSVSLMENAPPQVVNASVIEGVYTWDVVMPVTIQFVALQGDQAPKPIYGKLLMRIVRSSFPNNKQGIGIEQWIVNPMGVGLNP